MRHVACSSPSAFRSPSSILQTRTAGPANENACGIFLQAHISRLAFNTAKKQSTLGTAWSVPKTRNIQLVRACCLVPFDPGEAGTPTHTSRRFQGDGHIDRMRLYLIPIDLEQASTTIEVARTAGRIALTFVPLIIFRTRYTRKFIRHHDHLHPDMPVSEEKKAMLLGRLRSHTLFTHVLLFIPALLFWLGILASLEQTPLTGRYV